ncbi:MAG: hypothetical protein KatS3mg090_0669 [Patescibacteria group bacterium]|nr:MAG: hypothetical protein KatS3mg090_0669 [Patescibacteria group bacterium]
MKTKLKLINYLLVLGVIISTSTFLNDLLYFYNNEKTIFKLKGVFTNNPVLSPCFLGMLGFIIFLIWFNLKIKKENNYLKHFYWALIGANIFGWYNVALEFLNYYAKKDYNSCAGNLIKTPYLSPCLFGSITFLMLLFITKNIKKNVRS